MNKFKKLINGILNIIYPLHCASCSKYMKADDLRGVCDECLQKIKYNLKPYCPVCGRNVRINDTICAECEKTKMYFTNARSVCVYEGVVKELIHKYKFKNYKILGKIFSRIMIDFIRSGADIIRNIDIITFVPITPKKKAARGFNQSELISDYISKEFKIHKIGFLEKVMDTRAQNELGREERLINLKGAFRIRRSYEKECLNAGILIIDDVMTTGATMNEVSRILMEAGAKRVSGLTFARGIVK